MTSSNKTAGAERAYVTVIHVVNKYERGICPKWRKRDLYNPMISTIFLKSNPFNTLWYPMSLQFPIRQIFTSHYRFPVLNVDLPQK